MTPERAVLGAIPTVRFAEIRRLPHSAHRSDRLRQRCAIRSSSPGRGPARRAVRGDKKDDDRNEHEADVGGRVVFR